MLMEIERKYLIRYMPEQINDCIRLEIEQGYLCRKPVVRIRKSNDDYILTYKNKQKDSNVDGRPLISEEVEVPLNKKAFDHLKEKVDNHIISKTRYVIPLENGLKAELDVFHKRLEGLVFVEVEFPDVETSESFVTPDWFGEEITADRRYSNGNLSELDDLKDFKKYGYPCT